MSQKFSFILLGFEREELFKGVRVVKRRPSISHLFFADDSLIFCRVKVEDCLQLRHCFRSYEKAFSQIINLLKNGQFL